MKKLFFLFFFVFVFSTSGFSQTELRSTIADQKDVSVTVYNSNLGLVKDIRTMKLPEGDGKLLFMDVAALIQPETVLVKDLSKGNGFSVLEQNYEYDLMDQNKLLDKYVGKEIKLLTVNQYSERKEEVQATLLSNNNGQIYEIDDEIYLGHPGYKILPEIPEDLIAKPTLNW
ncbi:MAG: hypothetical protein PHQ52_03975, partial [Candidatus Omnitrophica bacterium]|nr:hypothetical protein [Candidatus Omnitrophota bacterium]